MLNEARRNFVDFLGRILSIPWQPSDDWARVRIEATFVARSRIARYRRERKERMSRPFGRVHIQQFRRFR